MHSKTILYFIIGILLSDILKGQCDVQVRYLAGRYAAKIVKTKLKE